jgi:hypothetical protein
VLSRLVKILVASERATTKPHRSMMDSCYARSIALGVRVACDAPNISGVCLFLSKTVRKYVTSPRQLSTSAPHEFFTIRAPIPSTTHRTAPARRRAKTNPGRGCRGIVVTLWLSSERPQPRNQISPETPAMSRFGNPTAGCTRAASRSGYLAVRLAHGRFKNLK